MLSRKSRLAKNLEWHRYDYRWGSRCGGFALTFLGGWVLLRLDEQEDGSYELVWVDNWLSEEERYAGHYERL